MKARSFIILAILLAYVLGTEAQSALTTDAMIRVAEQKSKLERMSADGKRMSPAQQPVLTFVVKVADEGAADTYARLREQGVTIRGRIGQQAIVQVPLDKVETIAQMDGILRMDVGHKGQLTTNVSREVTGVNLVNGSNPTVPSHADCSFSPIRYSCMLWFPCGQQQLYSANRGSSLFTRCYYGEVGPYFQY